MRAQVINLFVEIVKIMLTVLAGLYRFGLRMYRRFCIKVLWKRFHIETSVYHRWHDRSAIKMQEMLNKEHSAYSY